MRDERIGHYRFFILLFGLQMKEGVGARRLSLMKERIQISRESCKWGEHGDGGWGMGEQLCENIKVQVTRLGIIRLYNAIKAQHSISIGVLEVDRSINLKGSTNKKIVKKQSVVT